MNSIKSKAATVNTATMGVLLNLGVLALRQAGVQAELGGSDATKFKDSDVAGLLAARVANRVKM